MLKFFLGIFLFFMGISTVKKCFRKFSNSQIEKFLEKISDNIFLNIILGIIITSLLQSSSALSLILIGLLDAGLINLKSSLAVMIGANIGTTLTIQIISLPILLYYPHFFYMGLGLLLCSVFFNCLRFPGKLLISFSFLFAGLNYMSESFSTPFISMLINYLIYTFPSGNILNILGGAIITSLVQSSSVITGIIVTLVRSQFLNLTQAVALIVGSNIGTCITAFLACINSARDARRLALGHFLFNMVGFIFLLPFYDEFLMLIRFMSNYPARQLAYAHTLFNIFTLLIILPFFNIYVDFLKGEYSL